MIAWLSGIIIEKESPKCVINVGGVGYEVESSLTTFARLPDLMQAVELYIHTQVREDAHLLFGFFEKEERALFKKLIKVNGVGPKLALTILSSTNPEEFISHIQNQNTASLIKIPGIGKKTAERIQIEMYDSLKESFTTGGIQINTPTSSAHDEAMGALKSLGYKPFEVSKVLKELDAKLTSEELIRQALKSLSY
jgi:Holliday junction DNA helicase RuvA